MKTHELEMDSIHFPEEVVRFLEEHGLEAGDTLRLTTDEEYRNAELIKFVVIVVLAVIYFFKEKEDRISDGEKILDSVFKGKSVEEIEDLVQKEYGVRIEHHIRDDEDDEWRLLSVQALNRAYAINEPDYTEADVKEPNPEYKLWKDK